MTDHFELSIMIGSRAISGSVAIRLRNLVIACSESSIASSMFTSRMLAPPRTCSSATSAACAKSPARDQAPEPRRPGDVGALADHLEVAVGADGQRLEAGVPGEPVGAARPPRGARRRRPRAAIARM